MKDLNQTLNKYSNWFLPTFFIIAIALRWLYLPQNAISFAYDQARDAFVVQEMLLGHLKVLGPSVSGVPGLFHGVLYYYVIAPVYYFGNGNPIVVAYFLSFVSSLGVFVIYYLTKILTKDKGAGLVAALVFAFSFESTQYANLMTNASMGAWFLPLLYIGLYQWLTTSSKWPPIITALGLGLAIQSEIALGYHLFPVALWLMIFRKNITIKQLGVFICTLSITLSSMIISEIKFGFTGAQGILYLLTGGDGITSSKNVSDYFITLVDQIGRTFANTIFPINIVFGGLAGFLVVFFSLVFNSAEIKKKMLTPETFLISWIFAFAVALPFGGWNMKHLLVGVAPAVAILFGIFVWKYLRKVGVIFVLVLTILLGSNLYKIVTENKNGQTLFPLQRDLTLSNELRAIDFSYEKSQGQPFSLSTVTSPLFVNTLWSYLYNWHGNRKYGYLPSWFGRDQVGLLGNNLSKFNGQNKKHFFIIEPTYGIPELWVNYAIGDQDSMSQYISQREHGDLKIQERLVKTQAPQVK